MYGHMAVDCWQQQVATLDVFASEKQPGRRQDILLQVGHRIHAWQQCIQQSSAAAVNSASASARNWVFSDQNASAMNYDHGAVMDIVVDRGSVWTACRPCFAGDSTVDVCQTRQL